MIGFLKDLMSTVEQYPDRVALVDRDGGRETTYRELVEKACQVNAWLQKKGIGREQIVGIYYPKGMEYIAIRLGVMMAGAAWVSVEDMMGKERIDFVIRDAGCVTVFDMEKWDEAMYLEPCARFADTDLHDLAFLVYTSGSTGNPKGSAHEYGTYETLRVGIYCVFGPHAFPNGREGEARPFAYGNIFPETYVADI